MHNLSNDTGTYRCVLRRHWPFLRGYVVKGKKFSALGNCRLNLSRPSWRKMLSASSTRQQIFTAVQSNTKHQYALEKYSQRLTAELQEIDKLLVSLN